MLISPLLVAYGVALVVLQYVCSINYGGIEYTNSSTLFFNVSDNYVVESIGLRGNDYPAIALILKVNPGLYYISNKNNTLICC